MKRLFVVLLVTVSAYVQAFEIKGFYPYAAIGVGYKFQEPDYIVYNSRRLDVSFGGRDSALLELGLENRNWAFGIKHDSQWTTGWPANSDPEYYKTEIFVRYKIGGYP